MKNRGGESPNSWRRVELAVFEDVLDVLADRALGLAEELGKLSLALPKSRRDLISGLGEAAGMVVAGDDIIVADEFGAIGVFPREAGGGLS